MYIRLMVFDLVLLVVLIFSVFVGGKKGKEKMDDGITIVDESS